MGFNSGFKGLINAAISADRNLINEKKPRIFQKRMWDVKTKVIRATGTTLKSFTKYLTNIPGMHNIRGLKKTAILGTAHILWKVLMVTGHITRRNYLLKHTVEGNIEGKRRRGRRRTQLLNFNEKIRC